MQIKPLSTTKAKIESTQHIQSQRCILRELIQNSIDAHSTHISITITHTLESIDLKVQDNGTGISPEGLEVIGLPNHTSKVSGLEAEFLQEVKTFGFRGAAMYGIISTCSLVNISSKISAYNAGFQVLLTGANVNGSKMVKRYANRVDPITFGCSSESGTVVIVSDLFGRVPVRKKQMLNEPWNYVISGIRKTIFDCLIEHPHVSIDVFKDNDGNNEKSLIFHIPKRKDQTGKQQVQLLRLVYGKNVIDEYELFNASYKTYKIQGAIGLVAKQSTLHQYIYWNGRQLQNGDLFKSIKKKFVKADFGNSNRENIDSDNDSPRKIYGKPFVNNPVFLFCVHSLKNDASDLLQDPSKVCFDSKHLNVISAMIFKIVDVFLKMENKRLTTTTTTTTTSPIKCNKIEMPTLKGRVALKSTGLVSTITDRELQGKLDNQSEGEDPIKHQCQVINQQSIYDGSESPFFKNSKKFEMNSMDLKNAQVIKQIDNKFILIKLKLKTNPSNTPILLIMDQHACDERIKVESLYKEVILSTILNPNKHEQQDEEFKLEKSLKFELDNEEFEQMNKYRKEFSNWGIEFNSLENNWIEITHLPLFVSDKLKCDSTLLRNGIRQFLNDLEDRSKIQYNQKNLETWSWMIYLSQMPEIYKEIIKSKACRSSVMFGDVLSVEECQEMVEKLVQCKDPFRCAHGRPSVVPLVDLSEITRL
ncbi:hypothetical protein CANARDRAFT_201292 [[Candida] arabinofermentans NRRL YB-2248]|uniref:MutL C-terminal dimerisation domain-containing protein n=1 Tax=[Candida] arabinofermentans NRRL YB-2248 TaxID=983967 RepID=A0A1E4SXR7_9ASCO|nr:hypothetical protein CANARDRAFT_201292 [[Candida] arabinofermentans NRRL YB-2248]